MPKIGEPRILKVDVGKMIGHSICNVVYFGPYSHKSGREV